MVPLAEGCVRDVEYRIEPLTDLVIFHVEFSCRTTVRFARQANFLNSE